MFIKVNTVNQSAPFDQLFATAQKSLLTPYSIESRDIEQVFASMMAHRLDYADLYFQYSRAESWSLEEGIVKSGSFNIDQGVGVRAVSGEAAIPSLFSLPIFKLRSTLNSWQLLTCNLTTHYSPPRSNPCWFRIPSSRATLIRCSPA